MSDPTTSGSLPCACSAIRKTGRSLSRLYDEVLAPTGLRVTQYSVLATLDRLGPISLTTLAGDLVMDRTTLSRNLLPLERDGMVRIEPGDDKRARIAQLTEFGEQRLSEARPFWRIAQQRVIASYGQDRLQALIGELTAVRAATN